MITKLFPEGTDIEGFVQSLNKTNKEKKIVIKTSSSSSFDISPGRQSS